jgi:hypothetical protein
VSVLMKYIFSIIGYSLERGWEDCEDKEDSKDIEKTRLLPISESSLSLLAVFFGRFLYKFSSIGYE